MQVPCYLMKGKGGGWVVGAGEKLMGPVGSHVKYLKMAKLTIIQVWASYVDAVVSFFHNV